MKLEPKLGHFIHKTKPTHYNIHYSKAQVKLEPKFGHFIHKTKSTHYNTATPSSEAGGKIWSFYTQDKAYTLQYSYYKAQVKLEPKFGHFIHKIKPTHYNTATPRL